MFRIAATTDCLACPQGYYTRNPGASACTSCPSNAICLYGFPLALDPSLLGNRNPIQQQLSFNPYPDEISAPNAALQNTTTSILSLMGCAVLVFVVIAGWYKNMFFGKSIQKRGSVVLEVDSLKRSATLIQAEKWSWKKLDFLYGAAHAVAQGKSPTVYQTSFGGLMSVFSIIIVLLLAALLACQNTIVPTQASSVSTGSLPFEPYGTFSLVVIVYGNGYQFSGNCVNSSITLQSTNTNDWAGVVVANQNIYDSTTSSCKLTWACEKCQIASSFTSPRFVVQLL